MPIDLLADASAESFAAWLQAHPSVEIVSRDRGTTYANGATRGAPLALQVADRWHLIHNLGEALEKVLARHRADLKRAFTHEEEDQLTQPSAPKSLTRTMAASQAEQARMTRQERRRALFTQVQELYAQGWSGASIARMLGIHKKTAVKYATAEHFPESRSDHGRKLGPYLPYLQAQWAAGEHNIASLYQAIWTQGYAGSETSVRQYVTLLRKEIAPPRRPRNYYPPVSKGRKRHQPTALSSRRATWLVLRRPEDLSTEEQHLLDLVEQAHTQVKVAGEFAQAFAQMIRGRNAPALEPWLEEPLKNGVPELLPLP